MEAGHQPPPFFIQNRYFLLHPRGMIACATFSSVCGKGYQNALDLLRFLGTILQDAGIGSLRSVKPSSAE